MEISELLEHYLVAGGRERDFWSLTPRRLQIHLQAARRRIVERAVSLAGAVYVGVNASAEELERYQAELQGERVVLPPEALDGAVRAANRNLSTITMKEYLALREA